MPPTDDNNQSDNDSNLEFTFSDIPILGKEKGGEREGFSFETFKERPAGVKKLSAKPSFRDRTDHMVAYTKMLQSNPDGSSAEPKEGPSVVKPKLTLNRPAQSEQAPPEVAPESTSSDLKKERKGSKRILVIITGAFFALSLLAMAGYFLYQYNASAPPPDVAEKKNEANKVIAKAEVKKTVPSKKDVTVSTKTAEKGKTKADTAPPPSPKKADFANLKEVLKDGDDEEIEKEYLVFLKNSSLDLKAQEDAQNLLLAAGKKDLALKIYSSWQAKKSYSSTANYLYAKLLGHEPKKATGLYEKAILNDDKLVPAYLALGSIYEREKEWKKASELYDKCIKRNPDAIKANIGLIQANLKLGRGERVIREFRSYLREKKKSESEISKKLLPFSLKLEDDSLTKDLLASLKNDPKMMDIYKTYDVKNKALTGDLTAEDFMGLYPKEVRLYHILFLLSKGEYLKVLMTPTPPDEFPDFWKTYIGWKKNDKFWRTNAGTIAKKYEKGDKKAYSLIASLWLGDVKDKKVRADIEDFDIEERPLLCFMLSEFYKKKRNKTKAKVMYQKGLGYKRSPYRILFLAKNKE